MCFSSAHQPVSISGAQRYGEVKTFTMAPLIRLFLFLCLVWQRLPFLFFFGTGWNKFPLRRSSLPSRLVFSDLQGSDLQGKEAPRPRRQPGGVAKGKQTRVLKLMMVTKCG